MNTDEKAIVAVLTKYEDALNRSDTDAVMKLYAPDGVFMPQHFPSSLEADAIRKAYDGVFRAITLTVKFATAEIRQRESGADQVLLIPVPSPDRSMKYVQRFRQGA